MEFSVVRPAEGRAQGKQSAFQQVSAEPLGAGVSRASSSGGQQHVVPGPWRREGFAAVPWCPLASGKYI